MDSILALKQRFISELDHLYSEDEVNLLFFIFFEEYTVKSKLEWRSFSLSDNPVASKNLNDALVSLKAGVPYQYIVGHVPFGKLNLLVGPGVLIPRPETEEMLSIIEETYADGAPESLMDLGSGSGCLALGLAEQFRDAKVWAYDISQIALDYSRKNAVRNSLNIEVGFFDILTSNISELPLVDLLVSNPPYIALNEASEMTTQVKDYEPQEALFVDNDDPLVFYKRIESIAKKVLKPEGWILLEVNASFGKACLRYFQEKNWQAELLKDMSGNYRFLKVWA